jgi:hypothetical protein
MEIAREMKRSEISSDGQDEDQHAAADRPRRSPGTAA